VHDVCIRDLPRGEAERRLHLPDAPDAGDEAEPFQIGERRDDRLLAAHRQMGEPFEAREDAAVFLCQVQQRPVTRVMSCCQRGIMNERGKPFSAAGCSQGSNGCLCVRRRAAVALGPMKAGLRTQQ